MTKHSLIKKRNEERAAGHTSPAVDPDWQLQFAAARFDEDGFTVGEAIFGGVIRMHLDVGMGHGAMQLRDAHRHGAGVPMFEHAAGAEPEWIFGVGLFRCLLIGSEPDECFVIPVTE